MFTRFWEGLTEGLGERWSAQAFGATLLFWFGGALAWAWHEYGWWKDSWQALTAQVQGIQDPAVYLALTVGGLALLSVSSLIARRL